MCGIFFYLGKFYTLSELMPHFMKSSHRGPDSSFLRSITGTDAFMGFHRLAIVDTSRDGDQPFENVKTETYAMCNGEIYNHKFIRQKLKSHVTSKSDCAVILPLYEQFGIQQMTKYLDGDFGFLILDTKAGLVHLGRDPTGVKPIFYCLTSRGELIVASEIKSIIGLCGGEKVTMLSSGTTLTYHIGTGIISTFRYWNPVFPLEESTNVKNYSEEHIKKTIRKKLISAVEKRLMTDRPLGLLISGGLDSSLIAGITKKLVGDKISEICSFSIGMPGSPDVINAQIVADYLGTKHYTVNFTVEEGIGAVRKVIEQLETYDITTIRASTPQYLLSNYISENTDVKVILSGEGADELYAGYLYSHLAPSNDDLQRDSERLMRELEVFDVLRTDRTTAGNGLEVRVPFLDRGFIKYTSSIPSKFKNPNPSSGFGKRIEKKLLRDSFCNILGEPIIPEKIMYRIKNAFSDACGYDWIPKLKDHCEGLITDEEFSSRNEKYPHLPPPTKEAYFYRKTFDELYPNQEHLLPHYWLPNWMDNNGEPSAKVLKLVE
jgi:asparagine synthase (glutamine-hydrolysing)